MSIDEQIEAAFKGTTREGRYPPGAYSNTHMSQAEYRGFCKGYLAALRKFCPEIEPSEMVVGRYYWVGGMIGEMQGFRSITGKDGITRQWPIVNGMETCPDLFVINGPIPNGSNLPSPSDIFGRGE